MRVKNENIDETIYSICLLIHKICKLNLEFIGDNSSSSFELVNSQTPVLLSNSKIETLTYIHNFLVNKLPSEILYHTDNFQLNYLAVGFLKNHNIKVLLLSDPLFLLSQMMDLFLRL